MGRRAAARRRAAPLGSRAGRGRRRVTWAEVRAAYPVLERVAYLNAGTFGPLARATAEAVAERRRYDLEHGRSGAKYFESMLEARELVRGLLARDIDVDAG